MTPNRLRTARTSLLPIAVIAALALFAACQKSPEPPKTAPPAAPPQAAVPFRVNRVDLGSAIGADKKVSAPTTTFKPRDTIYASVLTEGASPAATLAARWTFEDGQLVNESAQNIAPTGPAATEFHIANPDGWPLGKYKVEVSANGKPAGAAQFTVVE
jgi:hypothetical protein